MATDVFCKKFYYPNTKEVFKKRAHNNLKNELNKVFLIKYNNLRKVQSEIKCNFIKDNTVHNQKDILLPNAIFIIKSKNHLNEMCKKFIGLLN